MIPIGDNVPLERYPLVNNTLIALNIFFFFVELFQGPQLQQFIETWGLVPARLMQWTENPWVLVTLFTSMFLHGGWGHLIGNMIYLHVYGRSVENALGSGRYLLFYILCGLAGGLLHAFLHPMSTIPTVGASGAISGVLGGYLLLYPHAQVFLLIPLFFWFPVVVLPAAFVLTWWFFFQFLGGITVLALPEAMQGGGVAYWAHIGGFVAGLLLVRLFRPRLRQVYQYYGRRYPARA